MQRLSICKYCTLLQVVDTFPNKADPAYQYSEVLHKSFIFYFQQRSGKLPHQVPLYHLTCMGQLHSAS